MLGPTGGWTRRRSGFGAHPLHTSLLLAKEYALTAAKIPAARAREMGLVNHVVADPRTEALACAKRILELPRQAVESTKRLLNLHLERAVLATLDYATTAEDLSFQTRGVPGGDHRPHRGPRLTPDRR
jgi:enoyl-CoA hydratase/carnithine racemase